MRCTFVIADPKTPHDFQGIEALDDADLLVVSVRRRAPTVEQMAIIRKYVESGKPVVGIRTACHAFDARGKAPAGPRRVADVRPRRAGRPLHGPSCATTSSPRITAASGAESHPDPRRRERLRSPARARSTRRARWRPRPGPLLMGTIAGQPAEPVAWVNRRGDVAGLLHVAGPSRRLREPLIPPAAPQRRLLGARTASRRDSHESRQAALLNQGRKGQGPLDPSTSPGRTSRSPTISRSIWSWPSRSSASRSILSFDERGRLWVVQYLQYPYPAGLKMLSHDGVWRAVYDKVPPPPPHHFRGTRQDHDPRRHRRRRRLRQAQDVRRRAEHRHLRARGAAAASGCSTRRTCSSTPTGTTTTCPTATRRCTSKGFGLEDTHSVVNSLRWGPDGWLYAAQGCTVTGHVKRPGLDEGKEPVHSMGQLIWRYHPETRRYEVFAEGGGNAFGVEIDAKGRIFSGHNGGDTRGFHYVQGATTRRASTSTGRCRTPTPSATSPR